MSKTKKIIKEWVDFLATCESEDLISTDLVAISNYVRNDKELKKVLEDIVYKNIIGEKVADEIVLPYPFNSATKSFKAFYKIVKDKCTLEEQKKIRPLEEMTEKDLLIEILKSVKILNERLKGDLL